jgi:Copper type II ascorbate-dependent monooxygenase, C-terminal domain
MTMQASATLSIQFFSRWLAALLLGVFISIFAAAPRAQTTANYQDLWWAGSQESGWGMSITQQGSVLFSVFYIYDGAGKPQWVVMPGGAWSTTGGNQTYTGALYIPTGSPFSAYDTSKFIVGASVGSATLSFRDANNATLSYVINGVSGSKTISRQSFGSGAPVGNYTDLWWGGQSQNGWGLSITQQGTTMYAVWYTYDNSGKTLWYVMPGGTFMSSNVYTGKLYRTSGAPWLGVPFASSQVSAAEVGSLTLTFTDSSNATMRFNADGASGQVAITRQQFGDAPQKVVSSFSRIQEKILNPSCNSCHKAGHPHAAQSGLILEDAVAYRNLVNAPVKNAMAVAHAMKQVVPSKADDSLFYQKLLLWNPQQPQHFGSAMPLGGTSLSIGQLEFIKRWIDMGAPETGDTIDPTLLDDKRLPSYAPFVALAAPTDGYQLKIDPFTVRPNFERELFVMRELKNPQPIYVTRVQTRMRANSHHLLLYTFQSNMPALVRPPANVVRDLRNPDNSLNIFTGLTMGYHVFFAGAMNPEGGYEFPPGVALELPANAVIDLNAHYVNKMTEDITGEAYANLHTVDRAKVTQVARTLNLPNTSLPLPPGVRTTHRKTFTFSTTTRILMLTSHTHKLGERFVIRISGGARNGEIVYDNTDWEHPKAVTFASPIVLQAGEGLTSEITYFNNTDRIVTHGLTSEDEMGIIFGYYY